jgi:hypothetical protein
MHHHKKTVDLHALPLTFQTTERALMQRFIEIYGHLPHLKQDAAGITIDLSFSEAPSAPPVPDGWPAISEDELVSYFGDEQVVKIRLPRYGLLTVDLQSTQIRGVVTANCLTAYGAFEDVLMIALAPLYRRRGWFPLHAFAAQSPGGQVALISGAIGAGKTTTGLALLTAGWKLLSNDSPLLNLTEQGVRVLAYPGRLSAFDDSLARFPALQSLIVGHSDSKRMFRAEEMFDLPWADSGMAGGIFFSRVVPGLDRSDLTRLTPTAAMLQLIPQAVEGWDKASIQEHMQLLGVLVEQVPCYNLRLAPAVMQLPTLLANGMVQTP